MAFNKLRQRVNTAQGIYESGRQAHEFMRAHETTIRAMSGHALNAAAGVRHDGFAATAHNYANQAREAATPERMSLLRRMAKKLGGAALNGAARETGIVNEQGKFSIWGTAKAAAGIKTGVTGARAARGAMNGVRGELPGAMGEIRSGWADAGPAAASQSGFNSNPFAAMPDNNPFRPAAYSPFGPPPQAAQYRPNYTAPSFNSSPQPFVAYPSSLQPVANRPPNPFGPPPGYTAAPPSADRGYPWENAA